VRKVDGWRYASTRAVTVTGVPDSIEAARAEAWTRAAAFAVSTGDLAKP
jgi:hypothetical protein